MILQKLVNACFLKVQMNFENFIASHTNINSSVMIRLKAKQENHCYLKAALTVKDKNLVDVYF